jgi:hypothetical protein
MQANVNTNAATLFGFRVVFRGKNAAGEYKRAVRNVYATDANGAADILAKEGESLAKGIGFKPTFVNIFHPLPCSVRTQQPQA